MHVLLLGVALAALYVALMILNDFSVHGVFYRRYRNHGARNRAEEEPYPNGRLRPEARAARDARLRAGRWWILPCCVAAFAWGIASEFFHPNSVGRGQGWSLAGVSAILFVITSTRRSNTQETG